MKFDAQDCELVFKKQLTNTIYDLRLKNKSLAEITKPGQFVQILVPSKTLRRPISVCDVENDTIRLVFEIRGEGTQILSETKVGEFINIIAPLGKGFDIDPDKKTIFIGGGIGVPPMLYSAKQCGKNATVINGFRNQKAVILEEDFKSFAGNVIITTDDGSYGIHGFVTQPLQEYIKNADMVCACGPMPMLKNISKIAKENNIPCQISLEQRMACGVGACLGCAVAVLDENGSQTYKHVCKDGPVFNSEEVVF
ncbi:MAG: dihydroorotate dehydrogenase electron transfer subunit [Clostridia bacterium]|nr:dihydroorotate dehydrogenase electron transfer subunit [Clostridia bacterium]